MADTYTEHTSNFIHLMLGSIPVEGPVEAIVQSLEVKKGTEILSIGQYCQHIWFLIQGAVRVFEVNKGIQYSTNFFTDQSLLSDYNCVFANQPSEYCFIAEENCSLLTVSYNDILMLYNHSSLEERIARVLAERQLIHELESRRMLQYYDGIERYEYLLKHRPELFQRFTLKHIASYIGVTPVSLSRLRKMK